MLKKIILFMGILFLKDDLFCNSIQKIFNFLKYDKPEILYFVMPNLFSLYFGHKITKEYYKLLPYDKSNDKYCENSEFNKSLINSNF